MNVFTGPRAATEYWLPGSSQQASKTLSWCLKRGTQVKVSFSDRVEVPHHVFVCALERELVLLNMDVEIYFGLDEMGTRMWQVLTASPTIQNAYSALLAEFDVDEATLRHDISAFLGKLTEKGLLRISSANLQPAPGSQ